VIGNDSYQHVSKLNNAKLDAAAIAQKLKLLGYTVSLHVDVNEKGFKQALRDFRGALEGGDEVLFYFAGHGVQLGSSNFLLPVDTKGDNEEQVKDEAVELQRVLDDLKAKNAKFALAIIDACRDNPFKQSGRAIGGPVTAGMPYLVGERGPELFVPQQSGGIVPNGGGIVINIAEAKMSTPDDVRRLAQELQRELDRRRRGGYSA
jgi:uncharacterized caspase-like protein